MIKLFYFVLGNLSTSENIEEKIENILTRDDLDFEWIEYYRQVLNAVKITKKLDQGTLSEFKKFLEQSKNPFNCKLQ